MRYSSTRPVTEELPRTVAFNESAIRKFLDDRIRYWRRVRDRSSRNSRLYQIAVVRAGAYQDMRASLLGSRLLEEQSQRDMNF